MQFQGKVYTEWMEVMGDYATVFSKDRGLNLESSKDRGSNLESSNPANENSNSSASVYQGNTRSLHYRVKASVRPEVYNIVSDVFNSSLPEWNELPSGLGLGTYIVKRE